MLDVLSGAAKVVINSLRFAIVAGTLLGYTDHSGATTKLLVVSIVYDLLDLIRKQS